MWALPRASSCRLEPSGFVPEPHKEHCLVLLLPKIVFLGSFWQQQHHTPQTCQATRIRLWVPGCADKALYCIHDVSDCTAKGSLSFPFLISFFWRGELGRGSSLEVSVGHSQREHRHWCVGGSSLNRNCSQTGPIINGSLSPFQFCADCWEQFLAAPKALTGLPSGMTPPL